jgi:hypothetical protein
MPDICETDLSGVFIVEDFLSRNVIDKYKSLGIDGILATCKKEPIKAEIYEFKGQTVVLLIDGCHKSRALYDLGRKVIPLKYEEETGVVNDDCHLLPEVPILDQESYNERWTREYGEPPDTDWF